MEEEYKAMKYSVIGAGPAGICEVASLLQQGVAGEDILWVDPAFKVGDFGTILSQGSSVPGNSKVSSYQKVIQAIYKAIPACAPKANQAFELDHLPPDFVCSLKVAALPLQHITEQLKEMVATAQGWVTDILNVDTGFSLKIESDQEEPQTLFVERVTLATGAKPKTLTLPISMLDPTIVFIESALKDFLQRHPEVKTVAVIGSSHSAALATMHLLKAGVSVKQFMNKAYQYAQPAITAEGIPYTMFDNTGLKGDVAHFTKKLFAELEKQQSEYQHQLQIYRGNSREEVDDYLKHYLPSCTHAVACIGYVAASTLRINHRPLSTFSHNGETMAFNEIKHLNGAGIAFPQKITAYSGEVEFAVGVEKFWSTANYFSSR